MASRGKSFPIAQCLNACPAIRAADKSLLIEVCSLYHNGGQGVCNASNAYLATKLGQAKETISRRLSRLQSAGWLLIDLGKEAGFLRTITPAPQSLRCYGAPTPAPTIGPNSVNTPLLTESIAPIDQNDTTLLTKTEPPIDHLVDTLLTIYGGAIDQIEKALLIVKEEQENKQKEDQEKTNAELVRARAENSELEKKIKELQQKVSLLTDANTTLNAQASHTTRAAGLAYNPDDYSPALVLPFNTDTFREGWSKWRRYHADELKRPLGGGMQEQEALRNLGTLSEKSESVALAIIDQAILKGWKALFPLDSGSPAYTPPHATTQRPTRQLSNVQQRHHVPDVSKTGYGKL